MVSRLSVDISPTEMLPNKDILEEVEKFISLQLSVHGRIELFDILDHFDVEPHVARMLTNRFEKRTSAVAEMIYTVESIMPYSPFDNLAHIEEEIWDDENWESTKHHLKSPNTSSSQLLSPRLKNHMMKDTKNKEGKKLSIKVNQTDLKKPPSTHNIISESIEHEYKYEDDMDMGDLSPLPTVNMSPPPPDPDGTPPPYCPSPRRGSISRARESISKNRRPSQNVSKPKHRKRRSGSVPSILFSQSSFDNYDHISNIDDAAKSPYTSPGKPRQRRLSLRTPVNDKRRDSFDVLLEDSNSSHSIGEEEHLNGQINRSQSSDVTYENMDRLEVGDSPLAEKTDQENQEDEIIQEFERRMSELEAKHVIQVDKVLDSVRTDEDATETASENKPLTWFQEEKLRFMTALQEAALTHQVAVPSTIAEMIILSVVILPGCYTFTGLLFPPQRNENDLFIDYAQIDTGYESDKVANGIQFKRKKPKQLTHLPENNTASLWLDEDGTICGFRCVWVQGVRRKLMLDQRYNVLTGCWTLEGEVSVSFEQFYASDTFTGYLGYDVYNGEWNAGNEFYGVFQWFVTNVQSFYLDHRIHPEDQTLEFLSPEATPAPFDPSIEDEFSPGNSRYVNGDLLNVNDNRFYHILDNKFSEVEINESLTLIIRFLKGFIVEILVKDLDKMFNDTESIGQGTWSVDGLVAFGDIKYVEQKTRLSFNACTDGDKLVGRLCMYYDPSLKPEPIVEDSASTGMNSVSPSPKPRDSNDDMATDFAFDMASDNPSEVEDSDSDAYYLSDSHQYKDLNDNDSTDSESSSALNDPKSDDEEDRVSFLQMLVVSKIQEN